MLTTRRRFWRGALESSARFGFATANLGDALLRVLCGAEPCGERRRRRCTGGQKWDWVAGLVGARRTSLQILANASIFVHTERGRLYFKRAKVGVSELVWPRYGSHRGFKDMK